MGLAPCWRDLCNGSRRHEPSVVYCVLASGCLLRMLAHILMDTHPLLPALALNVLLVRNQFQPLGDGDARGGWRTGSRSHPKCSSRVSCHLGADLNFCGFSAVCDTLGQCLGPRVFFGFPTEAVALVALDGDGYRMEHVCTSLTMMI